VNDEDLKEAAKKHLAYLERQEPSEANGIRRI